MRSVEGVSPARSGGGIRAIERAADPGGHPKSSMDGHFKFLHPAPPVE